jgi:hypothetical protein
MGCTASKDTGASSSKPLGSQAKGQTAEVKESKSNEDMVSGEIMLLKG